MAEDLRQWLEKAEHMGQLRNIDGLDWDLEIGAASALNAKRKNCPALLFDNIGGYPPGYRVLTCSTSSPSLVALAMNLPQGCTDLELSDVLRERFPMWENDLDKYPPQMVETGPILENVHSADEVDLFEFPAPKWNEQDGGRYIGTGCAIVTRDLDTGLANLGTYRVMVQDSKTTGLYISPGKHGRIHYEKYHARGEPCPVAVSVGHHPLLFRVACIEVAPDSEFKLAGAISEGPVRTIKEEITGLPIPADSEIVIAGWCPPGKMKEEGPFGEWTGYYASKERPAPVIEVERIYHRNDPIILGSRCDRPPHEETYFHVLVKSAMLQDELIKAGVPDVKGVWLSQSGLYQLIVVSIKQRYSGHVKQAAFLASQGRIGSYMGRYVIVVDEDIDPTNINDVLWALCTRSDPEKDIDIIRRARSSALDPMIRKPSTDFSNSRAIIDACKPYDWIDEFPREIKTSPELVKMVKEKWGHELFGN
jgi:UbiD family decarboxylase